MKRARFLLLSNIAFLLGVLCSTALLLASLKLWQLAIIFLLLIFLFWFFKIPKKLCAIFLIIFCLGILRFYFASPQIDHNQLQYYNDENRKITVFACVSDEVDLRRDHQKLTLKSYNIILNEEVFPVEGELLVTTSKFPKYNYGDCFKFFGTLQNPGEFDGFSYDDYLARFGIYSVMYRPSLQLLERQDANPIFASLFLLKQEFESKLNQLFHEPYSSFAAGLITGSRRGIPEDLMESFNITGLTHIIAISGYNITLLIIIISALFGFLNRWWRFWLSTLTIIAFVFFVGASAAVVRAAIMGVIGLIALQFGRKSFVILVLFFSAVLMNLYNPYILYVDNGFQLSFAATLGLILFADKFDKWIKWLPDFFAIRESFVMTMAAQVFTVPLIIFYFDRVSLISPVANVLVGPLIPLAMFFSFFAVISSYLWGGFAKVFAFIAWIFLESIVKIAQILAELSWASIEF